MASAKSVRTGGWVQRRDSEYYVIFHDIEGMHVYGGVAQRANDLFHPHPRFTQLHLVIVEIFAERQQSGEWPLDRNTKDDRDRAEIVKHQVHAWIAMKFADLDRLDILS